MTAVQYTDKRSVYCLSTICGRGTELITQWKKGGCGKEMVEIINDYNCFMNGVDTVDQHLVYYAIGRKGLKWWRCVFYRLLEMAIVNSYAIYKLNGRDKLLTHKAFRLELACPLCEPLLLARADPSSSHIPLRGRRPSEGLARLTGKHFIYRVEERGRCCVCAKQVKANGKSRDTKVRTVCRKCNVHLCIGECYELHHTKANI